MQHTLEAYLNEQLIFFSDGKWLHPLFDLEKFIHQHHIDSAQLTVVDKIVGRAAALLHVHLGIRRVRAKLMSRLAQDVFDQFQIDYRSEQFVDRIQCATEELLKDEHNPQRAYAFIQRLAQKKSVISSTTDAQLRYKR